MSLYRVVAFYKFVEIENIHDLQSDLISFCDKHSILGTILLAEEGINGTVAGTDSAINALVTFLNSHACFGNMEYKYSETILMPFKKIKVILKKEIVTFEVPHINPSKKTGKFISPEDWNNLISQEEVFLIDTRNDYEVELGTFQGAINPKTQKFTDFPEFMEREGLNIMAQNKHKKIAMFCTGGIRCEKASAYLLEQGFEEVYQLEGGILKYLEKIPTENSLWQGECFIFDRRNVLKKEQVLSGSIK